ncbi:MAG: hypothetical protein ACRDRM_01370 [Pseudonocardiaceae bacterium]
MKLDLCQRQCRTHQLQAPAAKHDTTPGPGGANTPAGHQFEPEALRSPTRLPLPPRCSRLLGADTYKDTVHRALERVVSGQRTRSQTESALRLFAAATRDLSDPDVMDAAWR